MPLGQSEWLVVAGVLLMGCAMLGVGTFVSKLWARQPGVLADAAPAFVANGFVLLAVVFVPLWTSRWRTAIVSLAAGSVFILFAGAIAGADPDRLAGLCTKSALLGLAIATIWVCVGSQWRLRRLLWVALLAWTLGLPLLAYLAANAAAEQDSGSTFFHLGPASFLHE